MSTVLIFPYYSRFKDNNDLVLSLLVISLELYPYLHVSFVLIIATFGCLLFITLIVFSSSGVLSIFQSFF